MYYIYIYSLYLRNIFMHTMKYVCFYTLFILTTSLSPNMLPFQLDSFVNFVCFVFCLDKSLSPISAAHLWMGVGPSGREVVKKL